MRDGRDEAQTKSGELSAISFLFVCFTKFISLLSIGHWKEQHASHCMIFVVCLILVYRLLFRCRCFPIFFVLEIKACVHVCAFYLCQGYPLHYYNER